MIYISVLIYVLIGIFAGFLGGLLGIGGGLVTVPSLLATFHWLGYPDTYAMQVAIGTSLGSMVITSASSAWAHQAQKGVNWHLFVSLSPGIVLGAIAGALTADMLPSNDLQIIFGVSICLIGCYFLIQEKFMEPEAKTYHPHFLIFNALGFVIGAISSIMGIGGGIITVPILAALGTPLRNAISTSAATGFLIACIGALSFLYLGLGHKAFSGTIGYLYVPAFIFISITSALAAPYGARLVYILPVSTLRKVFAFVMIIVGISMVYAAITH